MAMKKNKYLNGVGIFNLNDNWIPKFNNNNVELTNHLGISKVIIGKYIYNNCIYKDMYKFKPV